MQPLNLSVHHTLYKTKFEKRRDKFKPATPRLLSNLDPTLLLQLQIMTNIFLARSRLRKNEKRKRLSLTTCIATCDYLPRREIHYPYFITLLVMACRF